ncbi:hypothetical protein [Prauserella shujinwangii]|uniref:hypothetical protein n=1 Tax=Prauserella shujinwangii TaxID=1453103 RepID=UPI000D0839C0|nr:hypothetical protein [Prauserella shujinwangii]
MLRRKLVALAVAVVGVLAVLPPTAAAATGTTVRPAAARAYLDALVTHDASAVPLARDARRVENGIPTGFSGADIRWQLEHGPQYRVITGIRELTLTVRGDRVDTRYLLDTGLLGIDLVTTEITEYFLVRDGEIRYIDATIVPQFSST